MLSIVPKIKDNDLRKKLRGRLAASIKDIKSNLQGRWITICIVDGDLIINAGKVDKIEFLGLLKAAEELIWLYEE